MFSIYWSEFKRNEKRYVQLTYHMVFIISIVPVGTELNEEHKIRGIIFQIHYR